MIARAVFPITIALLIAAALPAQDAKQKADKFEGEWTMVSQETKGKKMSEEAVKQYKLTITAGQWIITLPNGKEATSTFKIDPSKDPKTIDLMVQAGDAGLVSKGIYKLEGDILTICHTFGGIDRQRSSRLQKRPAFWSCESERRSERVGIR